MAGTCNAGAWWHSNGMLRASRFLLPALTACTAAGQEWRQLPSIPDQHGVAAPFAGVSHGALIVAGGANFPDRMPWEGGKKVWHQKVWVLEKPDGAWREDRLLPEARAYGVSLMSGDWLVCAGGCDAERHTAEVFALVWGQRMQRVTVVDMPDLPIPLAYAAGAVTQKGQIYVAGGSTEPGEQQASARAFMHQRYDDAPRWKELPPLPAEPRILPVAAAFGDTFYLCGGAALEPKDGKVVRRYLRDAWSYAPEAGWKRLADMPKPAAAAPSPAPVVFQGPSKARPCFFVIGGDDGSLAGFSPPEKHPGFPGTILTYDINANTWTEGGKTPAPRATLPAVQWGEDFVFPSGEVRPGVRSPEVWLRGRKSSELPPGRKPQRE